MCRPPRAFDRTYEGLKPRSPATAVVLAVVTFDRTYEGLKLVLRAGPQLQSLAQLLTVPMRV